MVAAYVRFRRFHYSENSSAIAAHKLVPGYGYAGLNDEVASKRI